MFVIDPDQDGKVTADDFVKLWVELMSIPNDHSRAAFEKIDSDKDGLISKEELVAAIYGYYFDHSATSPGHWLLGPIE